MLFQGEEWGSRSRFQFFTDFPDETIGNAVNEGRKSEFASHDWDKIYEGEVTVPIPQALSTFLNSKLDWSNRQTPVGQRMLAWYRLLIKLRRNAVFSGFISLRRQANLLVLSTEHAQVIVNLGTQQENIGDLVRPAIPSSYYSFTDGLLGSLPLKIGGEDVLLIVSD